MPELPFSRSNDGLSDLMARLRAGLLVGAPGLVVLLAALIALFGAIEPGFFSLATARSFMAQLPLLGLLSLAMLFPLLTGGLNLAIIATANQCALAMAWTLRWGAPHATSPGATAGLIVLALLAGLALAVLIGLVTGTLVAYTGVHPILVTLGTKSVIDGISIYLTRGEAISGLPSSYTAIGNASLLGVPISFLLLALCGVVCGMVLRRTPFGIAAAMIGSNAEAARYSAIDVRRVLIGIYTLSSLLCFASALVMLATFNSASAGYAQSYLLVTILAAVLGGVDPFGGFGQVSGLMLALAVLQVISSGFNQLGLSPYLTTAIWGLTLIGVVTAQTIWSAFRGRR